MKQISKNSNDVKTSGIVASIGDQKICNDYTCFQLENGGKICLDIISMIDSIKGAKEIKGEDRVFIPLEGTFIPIGGKRSHVSGFNVDKKTWNDLAEKYKKVL